MLVSILLYLLQWAINKTFSALQKQTEFLRLIGAPLIIPTEEGDQDCLGISVIMMTPQSNNISAQVTFYLSLKKHFLASKINGTPKSVYLPISKLHSILAVANLLAHNNISQICYCGQISLQSAADNCNFSDNLTSLGGNVYFAGDGTCDGIISFTTNYCF